MFCLFIIWLDVCSVAMRYTAHLLTLRSDQI